MDLFPPTLPPKEEKDEGDFSAYVPPLPISTPELMGSSALGLSLEEDGDDDEMMEQVSPSLSYLPPMHVKQGDQQEVAIPRLMQMQMEKYGTSYFQRNESGYYSCFFIGCGKKLQANFSRHIAKHEQDGDAVDPNLAQNMKSASPSGPPMQTCSHPFHMAWWHTPPELPIGEFYNRSYKCKRCYIKQQMDRKKLRIATEKGDQKELATSSDSAASNSPTTPNSDLPLALSGGEREREGEEHTAETPPKKKKISHNPKDELILPEGWTTHTTTRKHGKSAGRVVPHWISPEGKKFRSKAAIKEFLAKSNPQFSSPSSLPPSSSNNHLSDSTPSPPPFSVSSPLELSSSILTPLEEDRLFGGMIHQRESMSGFKPILSLDDDDPLLSMPSHLSSSGFVHAQFNGTLPQQQAEAHCKVTGYMDGIGIMTQITIGNRTYHGFALNEDAASLAAFPPPCFSMDEYREAERHVKACRGIVLGEMNARSKSPDGFRSPPNGNGLEMHNSIHNHLMNLNDQLSTHLNNHLNSLSHAQHHSHHSHSHHNNHHPHTDSNSSTDTEVETTLNGADTFTNDFLDPKSHLLADDDEGGDDGLNAMIADLPPHPGENTGLLNTHMIISPRHLI